MNRNQAFRYRLQQWHKPTSTWVYVDSCATEAVAITFLEADPDNRRVLRPDLQAKFESMPLLTAVQVGWKLVSN